MANQQKSVGADIILVVLGLVLLAISMTGNASSLLSKLLSWLLGASAAKTAADKTKKPKNNGKGGNAAASEPAPVAVKPKSKSNTVTVTIGSGRYTEPAALPPASDPYWLDHGYWVDPKTNKHVLSPQFSPGASGALAGEFTAPAVGSGWVRGIITALGLA